MLGTDLTLLDDCVEGLQKKLRDNCRDIGTRILPMEKYALEVGRNEGYADAIRLIEEIALGASKDDE